MLVHGSPRRVNEYLFEERPERSLERPERSLERLLDMVEADVLVCGHTHFPANYRADGQLVFNPGSPTVPNRFVPGLPLSVGLLKLQDGNASGEIVFI